MKKLFAFILTVCLLLSLSATAFAADEMTITASIAPTYTVTIPADLSVPFNATETALGAVEIAAAQIEPDKCIVVTLTTDGKLENAADASKVIPYAIKDTDGNAFTEATYLAEGDKTELVICITTDDWNAAYAGDYSDTITFTVSYEDKT